MQSFAFDICSMATVSARIRHGSSLIDASRQCQEFRTAPRLSVSAWSVVCGTLKFQSAIIPQFCQHIRGTDPRLLVSLRTSNGRMESTGFTAWAVTLTTFTALESSWRHICLVAAAAHSDYVFARNTLTYFFLFTLVFVCRCNNQSACSSSSSSSWIMMSLRLLEKCRDRRKNTSWMYFISWGIDCWQFFSKLAWLLGLINILQTYQIRRFS